MKKAKLYYMLSVKVVAVLLKRQDMKTEYINVTAITIYILIFTQFHPTLFILKHQQ